MAATVHSADRVRRDGVNLAAFLIGIPLAVAILGFICYGPFRDSPFARYVQHDVEKVEVAMFCIAVGGLIYKVRRLKAEKDALRTDVVPAWDGKTVATAEAGKWLPRLQGLPARLRDTYFSRRMANVLDFLIQRGSAEELDDELRCLADTDAMAHEGSYALTRFITWAIPILGFIGTVLGITGAIAAVTPEDLEKNLGAVTGGLALAFDATALGLSLTMMVMFLTFLVERQEQTILEAVDRAAADQLAHRFTRHSADTGPFVAIVQQTAEALLDSTGQLVHCQAAVWSEALKTLDARANETHGKIAAAIEGAVEKTLAVHQQRLMALEKQTVEKANQFGSQISEQTDALNRLIENGQHLVRLQTALQQNLAALAGAGSFEQAVHSLTAAIHLMTARTIEAPFGPRGKAA